MKHPEKLKNRIQLYLIKNPNFIINLDNILGLRGWGLIFYGALPSNLALLGALEVKIGNIEDIRPFFFMAASFLPIFFTFILIRDMYRKWYLTRDFLNLRSFIVTFIVLILATLIIGISGIIHNRYSAIIPNNWDWKEWTPIAESFLLAVVSLIISSTLFMTALTKESNLPGLPSLDFIELIDKLQKNMRAMKSNQIWQKYVPLDDDELISLVTNIEKDVKQAIMYSGSYFTKESLKPICKDINNLINVINEIKDSSNDKSKQISWGIYFADYSVISIDQRNRRFANEEKYKSLERIKKLNLGE